jgi:hypothetical protein
MSPYLFLLVADVLQIMIKRDGGVRRPLMENTLCSVLQYSDDKLILLRGELGDVLRLRELLDSFSKAIGLKINYTKSIAVPMHLGESAATQCVQALGCRQEGFPQTYLGLPLSCGKLRLATFDPYIAHADRYLAGLPLSCGKLRLDTFDPLAVFLPEPHGTHYFGQLSTG